MSWSKLNEQYPVDYKLHSECFNDKYVTAHHAIIPTMSDFNIAQLLPDERRVYEDICRYYIMQFLPPIRKRPLSAIIKTEYGDLRATSTYVLDEGYKKYFTPEKEDSQEEEEDASRFDLPKGTYPIQLVSSELQEKETNPPKRYTQASLIRDMTSIAKYVQDKEIKDILKKKDKDKKGENGSIGTSATPLTDRGDADQTPVCGNEGEKHYLYSAGKGLLPPAAGGDQKAGSDRKMVGDSGGYQGRAMPM